MLHSARWLGDRALTLQMRLLLFATKKVGFGPLESGSPYTSSINQSPYPLEQGKDIVTPPYGAPAVSR